MAISSWSTSAASNNSAPPNGAPENMAPSAVNDVIRQNMADVRTQHEEAEWIDLGHTPTFVSTTSFTVTGDQSAIYQVGRRIRMTDATTLYGTIATSAYVTVTTVTVTMDSGEMSVSLASVAVSGPSITNPSLVKANLKDLETFGTAAALDAGTGASDDLPDVEDIQGQSATYFADGGTADAYVITPTPAITAYAAGQRFSFKAGNTNTQTSTLNISGLGVKTLKRNGGLSNLQAGDIVAGQIVDVVYDGTNFQCTSDLKKYYTGSPQALTASSTITFSHGLGMLMRDVGVWLECQTAELGYSENDEIEINPAGNGDLSNAAACQIERDTTNVKLHLADEVDFVVVRADTFAEAQITPANWKIFIEAHS